MNRSPRPTNSLKPAPPCPGNPSTSHVNRAEHRSIAPEVPLRAPETGPIPTPQPARPGLRP